MSGAAPRGKPQKPTAKKPQTQNRKKSATKKAVATRPKSARAVFGKAGTGKPGTANTVGRATVGRATRKPDSGYAGRKERERARQAGQSRQSRDIGPIPPVADPGRRAKAADSFRAFCDSYFPERFPLPWSEDHLRIIERLQTTIVAGGCQAFAMPRGSGKTTLCETAVLWAALTGRRRFVALIGASAAHADEMLSSIRGELECNELLAADWPEVCFPIAAIEGIHNRCKGQLCNGQPTRMKWAGSMLILPTVYEPANGERGGVSPPVKTETDLPEGSRQPARRTPASGAVLCVRGITGRVRGMKLRLSDGTSARPDLVIIDDPQTDQSARSEPQIRKRLEIIQGAILGLAGPGKTISAFCPCTVIQREDVADQLLDRAAHPEWHGERTKLVYAWPKSKKALALWDQYADLRRKDQAAGNDGSGATEFYREHQAAMAAGAKVAWDARHLPTELDALQHAYNLRIDAPEAFESEYQNEPTEQTAPENLPIDATVLQAKITTIPRYVVPTKAERLTWFIDVHKQLLYYAVCAWAPGFTGWVIDYGTWPKQPTQHFTAHDCRNPIQRSKQITQRSLEGQIQQALECLFGELRGRTWKREDNTEMHLDFGLVDANWGETSAAVRQACHAQSRAGLRVMPSHGVAFPASKRPISQWDRRRTKGRVGDEWHIPPPGRGAVQQHVVCDANRRKAFLDRRLATPRGDPGALSLFDAEPWMHKLLIEHLTSERRSLVSGPYGQLTVYNLLPGREDHWRDCLAGCCTAESILGGKLQASLAAAAASTANTVGRATPKKSKPVKYLDL